MNALLAQKVFHVHTNRLAKVITMCWFAGLVLGAILAFSYRSVFSSLMCCAVVQPVSIVNLLVSTIFPFALFAFAICNRKQWIICSICFYKSFSHFFCAIAIYLQFHTVGWLIYLLILFPDVCMLLLMFFLSFKYVQEQMKSTGSLLYGSAMVLLAVNGIVYSWISPILLDIF